MLNNAAMIIAGTVVGSAGTLLTQLMAKAMNRSLGQRAVLRLRRYERRFDNGRHGHDEGDRGSDAGAVMAFAQKVIIVPGYGMAVAQARHKIWELTQLLIDRSVTVKFAIHPVAGRMPGHMNVLLAEAGVPYDLIADLDEINAEFETADVALIIGANDVVNPVARTDKSSPIWRMPILNADKAEERQSSSSVARGRDSRNRERSLLISTTRACSHGDAQKAAAELIQAVKAAG